jgi:hypothetical protein
MDRGSRINREKVEGKFGFGGTKRVRKVDSLERYSIVSRLRAALALGLS